VPWNPGPKPCLCCTFHLLRRSGAHGSGRRGVHTIADALLVSSVPDIISWPITCSEAKELPFPPPLIRVLMFYATPLTLDPVDHVEGWPRVSGT